MTTATRKYSRLWTTIKQRKVVVIRCATSDVMTIKRELTKEKCRDTGFKLMNAIERPYLKISYQTDPEDEDYSYIEFVLKAKFGLVSIIE